MCGGVLRPAGGLRRHFGTPFGTALEPLSGFKPSVPVVFSSLFPTDNAEFEELREKCADVLCFLQHLSLVPVSRGAHVPTPRMRQFV